MTETELAEIIARWDRCPVTVDELNQLFAWLKTSDTKEAEIALRLLEVTSYGPQDIGALVAAKTAEFEAHLATIAALADAQHTLKAVERAMYEGGPDIRASALAKLVYATNARLTGNVPA